ncbi:MAG: agmatine deiminase [Lachnospiraceae bacterium]|nr:agmatine deiminase [Lachnospiraceae bacterium]
MNNIKYHMPAEFEKHEATVMIWPWRRGSWSHEAKRAKQVFRKIIYEIAQCEDMYVLAGKDQIDDAREWLIDATCINDDFLMTDDSNINELKDIRSHIHIVECENDDAWARDTGATIVVGDDSVNRYRLGRNWKFNAWGGDYNGLYANYEKDAMVAPVMCDALDIPCADETDFVLEGGSIHVDGEGTLITTMECLLSPGRNPFMKKEEIEKKLKETLGVEKIIWIPEGIFNDETDGHVDNICAFTKPGEVVLAWTDDENDPQYSRSKAAYDILINSEDARGRKINVVKLPIPATPILITEDDLTGYEFEEGEDERELGERLAASYVNFYIANDRVLIPQFDDKNDSLAVDILEKCFPTRKMVPIYARDILTGGGNIHCITQQVPVKGE